MSWEWFQPSQILDTTSQPQLYIIVPSWEPAQTWRITSELLFRLLSEFRVQVHTISEPSPDLEKFLGSQLLRPGEALLISPTRAYIYRFEHSPTKPEGRNQLISFVQWALR